MVMPRWTQGAAVTEQQAIVFAVVDIVIYLCFFCTQLLFHPGHFYWAGCGSTERDAGMHISPASALRSLLDSVAGGHRSPVRRGLLNGSESSVGCSNGPPARRPGSCERLQPAWRRLWHLFLMILGVVAIVLLSEQQAPLVDRVIADYGLPPQLAGLSVAIIVLFPESLCAIKEAWRGRLQSALNATLNSACSTLGLSVPVVMLIHLCTGRPVKLGLETKQITILAMAIVMSLITFSRGQVNAFFGVGHLALFAIFVYLCIDTV
eukprot:TRINITY_DN45559_c0_g1_i1.p1 TRINITY_DN45559_c0_g1~~TRINITY_DN45559_c0_g1_i1.p1  ORF type:complete len:264 (+),score=71.93 TRINITY_DN45559_c0_g1_i1:460-1251(+)